MPDATFFASLDWRQFGPSIAKQLGEADPIAKQLVQELPPIHRLNFAGKEAKGEMHILVWLEGDFITPRAQQLLRRCGWKKRPGEPLSMVANNGVGFVVVDGRRVLLGDVEAVRAALARLENPNTAAVPEALAKVPPQLRRGAIWFAGNLPTGAAESVMKMTSRVTLPRLSESEAPATAAAVALPALSSAAPARPAKIRVYGMEAGTLEVPLR